MKRDQKPETPDEFTVAAEAWRNSYKSRIYGENTPLPVLLMMFLAPYPDDLTGDLASDVLSRIIAELETWEVEYENMDRSAIKALRSRVEIARELLRRERAARGEP